MDIGRIFNNLQQWSRGLDIDQTILLAKLMAVRNARNFTNISADEIRLIQKQLLCSGTDADCQLEIKRAANQVIPVISETLFI
jgi:hypothetical protein